VSREYRTFDRILKLRQRILSSRANYKRLIDAGKDEAADTYWDKLEASLGDEYYELTGKMIRRPTHSEIKRWQEYQHLNPLDALIRRAPGRRPRSRSGPRTRSPSSRGGGRRSPRSRR